jgi:choline dehydrogenase-like flavoprotein
MIVAARTTIDSAKFDHCVVGAGPVGLALALELAKRGLRVLVLESGGHTSNRETQALSHATFATPNHDDMSIAIARRLGGTSNLWGGRCVRYDPIDFASRPVLPERLWPIGLEEIEPYHEAACRYLHCGHPVFERPITGVSTRDVRFSFTSLERWSNKPRFHRAHRAALMAHPNIEVRLHATVVDLEMADDRRVEAVIVAHPDGKRTRVPTRSVILTAGGIETTRLLLSIQRRIPRAFGGVDGPLGRYYMGHLIGEIADITFANKTLDKAFDFFVDHDDGSFVRRRFVPSDALQQQEGLTNVAFWPVIPVTADARHGSGVLSLVAIIMSCGPLARLVVAEAIRKRHIRAGMSRLPHLKNVLLDMPRATGFAAKTFLRRYVTAMRHPACYIRNRDMRYGLSYHAEQLPNPESRVRLTDQVDRHGLPRLQIDLRFQDADARAVLRTHELFSEWLQSTGFGKLEYRQPASDNMAAILAQARHGTHQIGLVRMAANAGEGVVDANLKCFGCDNLYVAGTGVLPTSGQAAPTLTALALALRLAHYLADPRLVAPTRYCGDLPYSHSTAPTPKVLAASSS